MKTKRRFRERAITMLLVFVMLFSMIPPCIVIVAEDEIDEAKSAIGSIVRLKPADIVFMYGNVTESGTSQNARVYPSDLPETFVVLDAITTTYGLTYYKLGTIDGSSHNILDVTPWVNAAAVEIVSTPDPEPDDGLVRGKVELELDGEVISSLTIKKGEKTYVFPTLDSEIVGTPVYSWQVLIDKENNRWANLMDNCYPYIAVTEALIMNACDESGKATLRCIVTADETKYVSGELTVTLEQPVANLLAADAVSQTTFFGSAHNVISSSAAKAQEEYTEFQIEVNYVFLHESAPDKNGEFAGETVTITLGTGSHYTGNITSPPNRGYKPYVTKEIAEQLQMDTTNSVEYPEGSNDFYVYAPEIQFKDRGEGIRVMVYYIPQQVNFMVRIHEQNLHDDNYTMAEMYILNNENTIADSTIGEELDEDRTGFEPLYYDPNTVISGDGSTVVDIYYDRIYYLVDFDLEAEGGTGYGVVPMYVRYNTQVMIGTPTNPGYTFDGWELIRVYTVDPDDPIKDDSITSLYDVEDGGSLVHVQHNVDYKARWEKAQTSYTVIYWLENADDANFSMVGVKTVDAQPGDVVSATNDITHPDKAYFDFNATLSDKDITVKSDGTTAVNAYYLRKYYTLTFSSSDRNCLTDEHQHDASCPNGQCSLEVHTHTDACGVASQTCGKEEHRHTATCCSIDYHKHEEGDCLCNTKEHVHTDDCYTCVEHKHTDDCYVHQLSCYTTETLNPPTGNASNYTPNIKNPQNGYVYRYRVNTNTKTYYNYFYFNGWYDLGNSKSSSTIKDTYGISIQKNLTDPNKGQYISVEATIIAENCVLKDINDKEHTHGDGTCTYKDEGAEHTHGEGTCPCNVTEHDHTSGCIYCSKEQHVHTPSCQTYSCGQIAHTHTADCVRACQIPVHTHGNCGNSFQIVKRKYGASISDVWQEIWGASDHVRGIRWDPTGNTYTEVLVYFPFMPHENITLTANSGGSKYFTMHYLLESLDSNGNLDDPNNYTQLVEVEAKYGYLTKAEDFFDIVGFKQYKSNPPFSGNQVSQAGDVYLYYERLESTLTFISDGLALTALTKNLMYEQPIGAEFEPTSVPYPTGREKNAVKFAGWYTTENCADGTEFYFDGSMTMPLEGLYLYAKWEPTEWKIKVYNEKEIIEDEPSNTLMDKTVAFGSMVDAPTYNKPYENYIFAGWYYVEDGEETRFDFKTMQVKKDLVIYAKWTTKVPVPYTIYYKTMKEGVLTDIATPSTGQSLADISKSFTAKVGEELDEGYRVGYYPIDRSVSIMMSTEHENEYTFIYQTVEKNSYTVHHTFTDENFVEILGTDTFSFYKEHQINEPEGASPLISVSFRDMVDEENVKNEIRAQYPTVSDADLKKLWSWITELSPNAYRHELILVSDPTQNIVEFDWTNRHSAAIYEIVYKIQNLDQNGYSIYRTLQNEDTIGHLVSIAPEDAMDITGFKLNEGHAGNVWSATLLKPLEENGGTTLILHYDRLTYTYTVDYYKRGTMEKLKDTVTKQVLFGTVVTEVADNKINNYHVVGEASITEEITAQNQAIAFYYEADELTYVYRVGEDGKGGNLSSYGETLRMDGTPKGSVPTPNKGYIFLGWYTDVDCTIPVTDDIAFVDTMAGDKITPINPTSPPDDAIYFYAKFAPHSLTIQNYFDAAVNPPPALDIGEQSFIYHIQGEGVDLRVAVLVGQPQVILGLPAGTYTVTVESEWSWRYDPNDPNSFSGVSVESGLSTITDISGMTWTLNFGGSDVMTVSYGIPAPDVSGTTGSNSGYFVTDNAHN